MVEEDFQQKIFPELKWEALQVVKDVVPQERDKDLLRVARGLDQELLDGGTFLDWEGAQPCWAFSMEARTLALGLPMCCVDWMEYSMSEGWEEL